MSEHTPGVWHVDETSDGQLVVSSETHRYLAVIREEDSFPDDVANAVLMASAPGLLAALQAIYRVTHENTARADYAARRDAHEIARITIKNFLPLEKEQR